jgi:hypothetical protein
VTKVETLSLIGLAEALQLHRMARGGSDTEVHVRAAQVFVIHPCEHEGHERSEIPALGEVLLVLEAGHQFGQRSRDLDDVPAFLADWRQRTRTQGPRG